MFHIDFEMFHFETRDRLRAMGVTDEELDRFVHVEPDTRPGEGIIGDLVEAWQPRLAIIDAAAGAYAAAGLDDHKRGDVGAFEQAFIDPFSRRRQGGGRDPPSSASPCTADTRAADQLKPPHPDGGRVECPAVA